MNTVTHRFGSPHQAAQGISLLEMLLVVGLIGVAGTLVATLYGVGLKGTQLRSSAKEVAAQLRYTRTQAISTGEAQRFEIDSAGRVWHAANGREGKLPDTLKIRFIGAREVQPNESTGTIVFFEDGGSTGGQVQLHSGQSSWQVNVAWLTGEVQVSRQTSETPQQ